MKRSSLFRSVAKSLIGRSGWQLQRIDPAASVNPSCRTPLETAMSVLLVCQGRVRAIQVGANDGLTNDPLNAFLMAHRDRTEVLLIEPQPYLIPALSENYKSHPAHTIANLAVGRRGSLELHAVDERCWPDCHADYAEAWPAYRAPTGVTSGDRQHVLRWLGHYYTGPLPLEQAIVTFSTDCMPLIDLAQRVEFGRPVDVLQVDVEGFDDEVLYHSSLEELAPKLINFENANLPSDRLQKLSDFLIEMGYELQHTGADTLAIRTNA